MNHLDLFSGIGGFALAARWAGINTIGFCEIDPLCQAVLSKNFPDVPIYNDIKDLKGMNVDLITGGFPCQPFSNAGQKKGRNDDRYLWPQFFRIIKESNPYWVIIENVTGLIKMEFDNICNDLEREGFTIQAYNIPACAVQAPHRRERIWLIAYRNRFRRNDGSSTRETRQIQNDLERYSKKVQQEWQEFIPKSWETFNTQNWLASTSNPDNVARSHKPENNEAESVKSEWEESTTKTISRVSEAYRQEDQPPIPGVDDGISDRVDRNKALGNAIVPQVIYPIMQFIRDFNE